MARFDHPHINKVYRFFKENGTAYLVLEYVEGDMLSELLKSKGRFNEAGVRRMLDELLDGLDKVHRAGYIHRDIKPANIIFRRDGSAVLLDFGAARQAIGQRSQMITSILTPGYAPVEQYLNTADAMGAWSDLYSLGVVAYRCLVGGDESVVIDAPSRAHYAQRGESEKDMPSAAEVGKGNYSDGLLKAIDWAMKVDERERPQSVGELRAVLAGEDEKQSPRKPKRATTSSSSMSPSQSKPRGANKIVLLIQSHKKWLVERFFAFLRGLGWTVGGIVGLALVLSTWSYGNTPLHYAAERNAASATMFFIANGVDVNAHNGRGDTPLHLAARHNAVAGAKVLLANGADANAVGNKSGLTPLHLAASNNAATVVEVLLTSGADVNARNKGDYIGLRDGSTPLHLAAEGDAVACAKVLLANGADVNAKENKFGFTPLHEAAFMNNVAVAKILLTNDAYVNAKTFGGRTPFDVAQSWHTDMQSLLRQHGGQCNVWCK